jgi:uncharacterized protein (DUF885 family)
MRPGSLGASVIALICATSVHAADASGRLRDLIGADVADARVAADAWPDLSLEALKKREASDRARLAALHSVRREQLPIAERTAWDLLEWVLDRRLEQFRLGLFVTPFWSDDRYFRPAPMLATANAAYGATAGKQQAFPEFVRQVMVLMRQGMERKMLPSREFVSAYEPGCGGERAGPPAVVKAAHEFCEFLVKEYAPACPVSPSIKGWPNGAEVYGELARRYTTTDLTPRHIGDFAVKEVERIRGDMAGVMARTGFKGSLDEFLDYVRTDRKFYFDKREDLLSAYREAMARIEPRVSMVIGFVPRKHVEVEGVDGRIAAMWRSAVPGRSGPVEMVSINEPRIRPKFEIIPLMLHEGTPGHDLQHAVADTLHTDSNDPVASFVASAGIMAYAAYGEGWGMYAESLGREMSLYDDPYDEFGMLRMDLTRAVRAVVDTGINVRGWSLEEAKRYFMAQTGKPAEDVASEIARTHSPGGQLAYKIGLSRLLRMRKETQEELGSEFDLRRFNDAVLRWGPLPLDVLAGKMRECLRVASCREEVARPATAAAHSR